VFLFIAGCATPGSSFFRPDLSKISVGMSKPDVLARLGEPHEVAAQGGREYFIYNYDHPFDGRAAIVASYFVRFTDGKVDSFGKRGEVNPFNPFDR
jgi:outer membrane protein assembly factor BamE (lipoprotein component of BamABCDE complex)